MVGAKGRGGVMLRSNAEAPVGVFVLSNETGKHSHGQGCPCRLATAALN
jgi:hypothetical protein